MLPSLPPVAVSPPVIAPVPSMVQGATGENAVGSLPLQWTRFWGREPEMTRLRELLWPETQNPVRLVTLVGPGGVGKTRLAVETAARLRAETFGGGVWFVALETPEDSDSVSTADEAPQSAKSESDYKAFVYAAIARVLRLRDPYDETCLQGVIDALFGSGEPSYLEPLPVLLILDSSVLTETAIHAIGRVIQELLERAPSGLLRCVFTSRQRLDVAFERAFAVETLPVPPKSWFTEPFFEDHAVGSASGAIAPPTPAPAHLVDSIAAYPSVALFVERAQAVRPDFQITPRNAFSIADLCWRFDGLPLALEIAATWTRLLTPAQMVEKTRENPFVLLASERRDLTARHRALQTVLRSELQGLSPELRAFLSVLSVFEGGWTLHAAQAVLDSLCQTEAGLELGQAPLNALTLLDALQARSLVLSQEADRGLRFRLLQTVRAFAPLQVSSEFLGQVRRAHAQYYANLAQSAEPFLSGMNAESWRVPLDDAQENLRAALRSAVRTTDGDVETVERGLVTASALWRWWYARGKSDEGSRVLESLLAQPAANRTAPILRARACHGAGRLALNLNQAARAGALFAEAAALLGSESENGETSAESYERQTIPISVLATDQGIAARAQNDYDTVLSALETLLAEKRRAGDAWGMAVALTEWGSEQARRGDAQSARQAFARSAFLRRALGDRWGAVEADLSYAHTFAALNDSERAGELITEAERAKTALGDVQSIAASFLSLGYVASEQGDWETALPLLRDAASLYRTENDGEAAALVLWVIARCAADRDEVALALSAAENALTESQSGSSPANARPFVQASDVNGTAYAFSWGGAPGEPELETRVARLAGRIVKHLAGLSPSKHNGLRPVAFGGF